MIVINFMINNSISVQHQTLLTVYKMMIIHAFRYKGFCTIHQVIYVKGNLQGNYRRAKIVRAMRILLILSIKHGLLLRPKTYDSRMAGAGCTKGG